MEHSRRFHWASCSPAAADTLDWWGDLVQPLLLKKHGATFLSSLAPLATPADFFSDERRLRLGTPTLLEFFDMIGMSGTAVGSVASVLKSLRDTCDSVDNFPPRWLASATACRKLMVLAGVRFFHDAGLVWTQMLHGSTEHAVKPVLLAPPESGGHAHLADLRQILVDTKVHLRKEELLGVDPGGCHLHYGGPQCAGTRLSCLVSWRLSGGLDYFCRAICFRGWLSGFHSAVGDRVAASSGSLERFDSAGSAGIAGATGLGLSVEYVLAGWQRLLVLERVVRPAGQVVRAAAKHEPVQAHDKLEPAA